ncbi:COMM domain-containing protein 3 [Armigeres subalbatus]|uniref:COMM domain-containing protein 3 n=1 Tax=Armigeres subalbatus TaxID=124917 RepID=UPI002ED1F5FA
MDLSEAIQKELQNIGHQHNVSKIINKAFETIVDPVKEPIAGGAQYALATVLVLACKYDYDYQQLRQILEIYILESDIVDKIVSKYSLFRDTRAPQNAEYGIALPHVTDANWTLRSDLSSSSYSVSAGNLSFSIELETFNRETDEKDPVIRFTCTPEELQLFINKLKDVELNCDKLSRQ